MADREQTEAEIRHLLATETRTTVLSNKLFQQGTGLFARLATTEEERRALVQTELFRTAQSRVRELQYRDADVLREAAKVVNERLPDTDVRISLDAPVRTAT
jgi:hypothetical protein